MTEKYCHDRDDGRCQMAIDNGIEGIGSCPVGSCASARPGALGARVTVSEPMPIRSRFRDPVDLPHEGQPPAAYRIYRSKRWCFAYDEKRGLREPWEALYTRPGRELTEAEVQLVASKNGISPAHLLLILKDVALTKDAPK